MGWRHGHAQAPANVSWPMAGFNLQHTGENPYETLLSPSTIGSATQQWATSVGGTYIDDQPILAANVNVGGALENLLYIGDEHGHLTALNATTGAVVWQRTLGWQLGGASNPGCSNSPFGISGSPVVDQATNTLYVVDGTNNLYALDMSTGATQSGWPISLSTDSINEHVWSALNLLNGILYVPMASECDAGPYRGRLLAVNTSTRAIVSTFYVNGPKGAYGGSIWGYSGASFSTSGYFAFVGTGNAIGANPNAGHSDSIVKLQTSNLAVSAANNPGIVGSDSDFGSTPVLFQQRGCPPELALENKNGVLYLYDQGRVHLGPLQSLQISTTSSQDLIGDVAWSSSQNLLFVSNAAGTSPYPSGLLAFKLVHVGGTCELSLDWQTALGPSASVVPPPIVANGVVYYADGTGNTIYAIDETSGAVLFSAKLPDHIMSSPIVVNGMLYVPDWNGEIYAFGLPKPSGHAQIDSGWDHTLALDASGNVYSWGNNASGQLGNGTTTGSSVPVAVTGFPSGTNIVQVAAGYRFSVARDSAGNVWAWGSNTDYQLGATTPSESVAPVEVAGLSNVVAISAGFDFVLALESNGTVWAWGSNWDGQLGNGVTDAHPIATPVEVKGISSVTAIAAGGYHALAIVSGGGVYAWGYNGFGQLGNASTRLSDLPVQVPGVPPAAAVAAGTYHSLVLATNGSVWAFGLNNDGQLGTGNTTNSDVPVEMAGVTAAAVAAGGYHSLVEKTDGTLWAVGLNAYGQLGDNSTLSSDVLVEVSGVTNPVDLAAGGFDSLVIVPDGQVLGFGSNADGRLGNGTTTDAHTPVAAVGFNANA